MTASDSASPSSPPSPRSTAAPPRPAPATTAACPSRSPSPRPAIWPRAPACRQEPQRSTWGQVHRDPLPAHTVRNATVGGIRDARTAGIRPANAPIRMAHVLGELEGSLLLLGVPLVAREARWLQALARAEGLIERRRARVQRRAVRYRVDRQRARRVRIRKRADTAGAHALGEPHRLLMNGGAAVAAAVAAAAAGACVAGGSRVVGRCGHAGAAATGAATARA